MAKKYLRKPKRVTRRAGAFTGLQFVKAARSYISNLQDVVQRVGDAIIGGDFTGNARGTNALDIQIVRGDPAQVASGAAAIAFGKNAQASGSEALALCSDLAASATNAIAVGKDLEASELAAIAIGLESVASGVNAQAIGGGNTASNDNAVAMGNQCSATGGEAVAMGSAAEALADNAVALGSGVAATAARAVAIGSGASAVSADEACIAGSVLNLKIPGVGKKAVLRDGSSAGGALTGTFPNPTLADGAALAEILDDDGAGSGLDADLLDGSHASAFATSGHTHTHASTTGQGTDDHHAQSYAHNGSDGSGTVGHASLTGVSADDHHAQTHNHGGGDGSGLLNAIGAHVTHSGNLTISTATWTDLNFNTERFDSDAFHDTSTNNQRLTVPTGKGGKYLVTGGVEFANNATGYRALAIHKNGSTFERVVTANAVSGNETWLSIAAQLELAAADYVTLRVFQNSGGNLNVQKQSNYSPEFSVMFMGA